MEITRIGTKSSVKQRSGRLIHRYSTYRLPPYLTPMKQERLQLPLYAYYPFIAAGYSLIPPATQLAGKFR